MKNINELIKSNLNIKIKSIETNSKNVKDGSLFVAVNGFFTNHEDFIDDAIRRGAVCIIASNGYNKKCSVPLIKVEDVNKTLFNILDKFYDNIFSKFFIVGITGTDGKTTTSSIASEITDSAYIGTNGIKYKNFEIKTDNTTPDEVSLYKIFDKLYKLGARKVIMEVSSEALLHDRCHSITFDIACLTNVSEDHLNIHKSLDNYIESKEKLFKQVKKDGISILNVDSMYYDRFKCVVKSKLITYGINNSDFNISNINLKDNSFTINDKYKIKSHFPFVYNMYNITLAFIIGISMGFSSSDLIRKISLVKTVPGRTEKIDFGQDYAIILDYAHTLNAIQNLVLSVKNKYKRVFVVTGAAGGREKKKRKEIGKFLLSNTYLTIVTMDDPRSESVDDIIDDMISESNKINYLRINDRSDAINKGLSSCKKGDIILIIGKGRDNYMAIGNKKIPYNDFDVIKKYFEK